MTNHNIDKAKSNLFYERMSIEHIKMTENALDCVILGNDDNYFCPGDEGDSQTICSSNQNM